MNDKVKELEQVINAASGYGDICNDSVIEEIYKCSPGEKSRLLVLARDKVASLGKDYKKAFDSMLKDYDNVMKINSYYHTCDTRIFDIPKEYNVVEELDTGEFILNIMGIHNKDNVLICPTPILPLYLYRESE